MAFKLNAVLRQFLFKGQQSVNGYSGIIPRGKQEAGGGIVIHAVNGGRGLRLSLAGVHNPLTEMAATGESAGGCLAMLYAYREPEQSPIPVKFVFQMTGPASFEPLLWGAGDTQNQADFVTMMSGEAVTAEMIETGEAEPIIHSISPAALVDENTVPTILAYGPKDKVVPVELKFRLIEALEQYGVPYDYIEFSNSGHLMAFDREKAQEYADTVLAYMDQYFENGLNH